MKLRVLHEMDYELQRMKREINDPSSEEEYKARKARSLTGWRRVLYDTLVQVEEDPITGSVFPQMLRRIIPIDDKIRLIGIIMQDLTPNGLDLEPLIQAVENEDWTTYNRAFAQLTVPPSIGPQHWHNWDDGSVATKNYIDAWIRILAHQRTKHDWLEGRTDDMIASFYYGKGGWVANHSLRDPLMKALEEMVYE